VVITHKAQERVTKEELFSKLCDYDVYHMYVPEAKVGVKSAKCPYRTDKHIGSWCLFRADGVILWKDFATGESGNCITLVQKMYNLTYQKALEKIAQDFGIRSSTQDYKRILSQYSKPVIEESKAAFIQIIHREEYTKADIEYWSQYMISTEELLKHKIRSVTELYVNRQKVALGKGERVYAYEYPDGKFKIYRVDQPKGQKWKSNIPCSYVENTEAIGDSKKVLVTKSLKDRIVLSKIVPYPVINVQNEGSSAFTPQILELLKGREVIINYDADPPGVANCKKICDLHKFSYVNIPRILYTEHGWKDVSDWLKGTGSYSDIETFLKSKNII